MSLFTPGNGALRRSRFFYGWFIAGVCWVAFFMAVGIGFYAFGVLFLPWEQEFGWSRTAISGAFSLAYIAWGLAGPFLGRLTDIYGARRVMVLGALTMGLGLFLLSRTSEQWHLYVSFTVINIGAAAIAHIPVGYTISKWFVRKRGLAMGLTMTGMGIGGSIVVPVTNYLIQSVGWRTALIVWAVVVWAALIPLTALVLRSRPEDMGLLADNQLPVVSGGAVSQTATIATPSEGLSSGQALRSGVFWAVTIAYMLVFMAQVGLMAHQIPYFSSIIPAAAAAVALSITAFMSSLGKIIFGFLADRIAARYVLTLGFSMSVVGTVLLLTTGSVPQAFLAGGMLGLASAAPTVIQPLLIGSYFGMRSMATILGFMMAIATFGTAVGPIVAGYIYDMSKSYQWAFTAFLVAFIMGITLVLIARPRHNLKRT